MLHGHVFDLSLSSGENLEYWEIALSMRRQDDLLAESSVAVIFQKVDKW